MAQKNKKEHIARVVNLMMLRSNLDDFTISDICKECGVSRQCFYNNFKDKYDVIDWIYQTEAVDYFSLIGEDCSWCEAVITKLNMVKNNATFYRKVYRQEWFLTSFFNITKKLYMDAIRKRAGEEVLNELEFQLDFYCTACVRTTGKWVLKGFRESPEEVVASFFSCIPDNLRHYLVTKEEEEIILQYKIRNG